MTTVGGDGRPLEDILNRLNDLSRVPREIDLREPPPVPAIDLTAPAVEPATSDPGPAPANADSAPVSEVITRESSRVARSSRVENDSRYGRNGAVAPTVVRQAPTPHDVPVLPVSVNHDEHASAAEETRRRRRWVLPVLFLVLVVVALAVVLLAL